MRPILSLEGVHAHDGAGPRGKPRGSIAGVTIGLGPGVHAVLGAPEDGTLALHAVVSGERAPVRGEVTVAGREPARTAFIRARLGVLAPEPQLPAARTVRESVRMAMRARGESGDGWDAALGPLGLGPLHGRDPRSLSFAEERAVELSLALSTPAPLLLALHEPLADVALPKSALLLSRLRELGNAGACVLVTTSSPADARALADRVLALHRGVLAREVIEGAGTPIELAVWASRGARALLAALAARPEVQAMMWEDARSGGDWPGAAAVRVRGADAEATALAVAEAVAACGDAIEVLGIERRAPDLGELRAATEALFRMARAHAAASQAAPPMPPRATYAQPIATPPTEAPAVVEAAPPIAGEAAIEAPIAPAREGAEGAGAPDPEAPR